MWTADGTSSTKQERPLRSNTRNWTDGTPTSAWSSAPGTAESADATPEERGPHTGNGGGDGIIRGGKRFPSAECLNIAKPWVAQSSDGPNQFEENCGFKRGAMYAIVQ